MAQPRPKGDTIAGTRKKQASNERFPDSQNPHVRFVEPAFTDGPYCLSAMHPVLGLVGPIF